MLLLGTLFAWVNFAREFIAWTSNKPCQTGCTFNVNGVFSTAQTPVAVNPFLTPCFYGAIFFTVAFILSVFLIKKLKSHTRE